jgi:hypothetical protein
MKKSLLLFFVSAFLCLVLLSPQTSFSYPRFAAYTGDKCGDCHVNPSGGSMRSEWGTKYGQQNLEMDMFKKLSAKMEFSPKLSKSISVGGDVRIAHSDNQVKTSTAADKFLAMEGNIYINAKLNEKLSVFVSAGLQSQQAPVKNEFYGLLSNISPAKIYFQAGKFSPSFGIRIPDHRAYQRLYLLNTPYDADAGFLLGISPGDFNMNVAVFNGLSIDFFDTDLNKMFVASADYTFHFAEDLVHVNLGTSFYNNPFRKADQFGDMMDANQKSFNGFTKIGLFDRVAILGEVDFIENQETNVFKRGMYNFGELSVRLVRGVELRGQYEMRDPNRDVVDDEISRISAGFALFPMPGMEMEGMYRFVTETPSVDNNEYQMMFHFYF